MLLQIVLAFHVDSMSCSVAVRSLAIILLSLSYGLQSVVVATSGPTYLLLYILYIFSPFVHSNIKLLHAWKECYFKTRKIGQ